MKKTEVKKNNNGFSLVELIVVIAIMAVLVGVLAPQFIKYVEKSRESTDIQNAEQVATAMKTYYVDQEGVTANKSVTITNTGATGDTEALTDAGIAGIKLKSSKWGTGIVVTYHNDSGQTTVTGSALHYYADGTKK